jgi:hypothetical protein
MRGDRLPRCINDSMRLSLNEVARKSGLRGTGFGDDCGSIRKYQILMCQRGQGTKECVVNMHAFNWTIGHCQPLAVAAFNDAAMIQSENVEWARRPGQGGVAWYTASRSCGATPNAPSLLLSQRLESDHTLTGRSGPQLTVTCAWALVTQPHAAGQSARLCRQRCSR